MSTGQSAHGGPMYGAHALYAGNRIQIAVHGRNGFDAWRAQNGLIKSVQKVVGCIFVTTVIAHRINDEKYTFFH